MPTDIIPPSEIHSELARIWDTMEGSNKMRASLFNLVFYTKNNPRRKYIRSVSEKVVEKFPSRVIFITSDEDSSQDYLNTRVSVIPSGSGDSDIACDYIEIEVAGKHEERIPFVILPHVLPDLPIFVIWAEDPEANPSLFAQLQKLATRVIFDSEAVDDLPKFSKQLLDLHQDNDCEIADLNWGRMESWRSLISSTFYTTKRLEKLKNCTSMQVYYNSHSSDYCCHTIIQSLYLQGWVATQLEWELEGAEEKEGKFQLTYNNRKGKTSVELIAEDKADLKPGTILSIDIGMEDQGHFSFGRDLEIPNHVSMRFSTLEKCDIPLRYIFAKDELGKSLVNEICQKGTSNHFLNLLDRVNGRKEYSFREH